jgi:hypothetical protein
MSVNMKIDVSKGFKTISYNAYLETNCLVGSDTRAINPMGNLTF